MSETLREVERVAERWAGVLEECKKDNPRWLLDPSTMTLESALNELRRALLAATAPTPDHDPLNTRCDHNINRLHVALPCTCTAPTPDEPPVSLRVPLNREPNPDGDGLNVGVEHVEVHVRIDPDCETLGKATWEYAYDHRLFPVITLREPNEQVLLHELLHIALVQVPADRLTALNDPHGHDIISRIEVALWETGWRRVGSVVTAPTPDEVGLVEVRVSAALAPIRELYDLYMSWEGEPDHPGSSSPRQREQLREALDRAERAR